MPSIVTWTTLPGFCRARIRQLAAQIVFVEFHCSFFVENRRIQHDAHFLTSQIFQQPIAGRPLFQRSDLKFGAFSGCEHVQQFFGSVWNRVSFEQRRELALGDQIRIAADRGRHLCIGRQAETGMQARRQRKPGTLERAAEFVESQSLGNCERFRRQGIASSCVRKMTGRLFGCREVGCETIEQNHHFAYEMRDAEFGSIDVIRISSFSFPRRTRILSSGRRKFMAP